MFLEPSPVAIEWAQERLVAPPLEVDLVDLLTELERTPDDPELHDLYDHLLLLRGDVTP
jgi:hypothetical protein